MKMYVVEETENAITVGFKDINLTLVAPLIDELGRDSNIAIVRFIDAHPELKDRCIQVDVKSGSPRDAIKKALNNIAEYYKASF